MLPQFFTNLVCSEIDFLETKFCLYWELYFYISVSVSNIIQLPVIA